MLITKVVTDLLSKVEARFPGLTLLETRLLGDQLGVYRPWKIFDGYHPVPFNLDRIV